MAKYRICPGCGLKGIKDENNTEDFFVVFKCRDCGQLYCEKCQNGRCPRCGSTMGMEAGKVHYK